MRVALPLLCLLAACTSPVVELAPDDARDGTDGQPGPFSVAHQSQRAQVRASDVLRYEVSWPAEADGRYAEEAAPCPVVVFVHGGFVGPDRYRWLATHLSTRGYCVLLPHHPLQLAITTSDHASLALDDLLEHPPDALDGKLGEGAVVAGHSLGGAVASFRWVDDERFVGLALLASWPSEGTDVEAQTGRPSLSLIGSEDKAGEATQTAYEVYERFPEPRWFGVIDGMNHYDWADDNSDADLRSDGIPTRPREATRRDALRVLDAWLDATLRGDAEAQQALSERAFPGIAESP